MTLADLQAACDRATKGPWIANNHPSGIGDDRWYIQFNKGITISAMNSKCLMYSNDEHDSAFIALSREAVPKLLAFVQAYDELVKVEQIFERQPSSRARREWIAKQKQVQAVRKALDDGR